MLASFTPKSVLSPGQKVAVKRLKLQNKDVNNVENFLKVFTFTIATPRHYSPVAFRPL